MLTCSAQLAANALKLRSMHLSFSDVLIDSIKSLRTLTWKVQVGGRQPTPIKTIHLIKVQVGRLALNLAGNMPSKCAFLLLFTILSYEIVVGR